MDVAALIPVKSFRAAKGRLADVLEPERRFELARWMAGRVLDAAADLPTFVACDDDEVAEWAEHRGATVLWGPGLGLNGAVDHGVSTIAGKGHDHVVISHGDLPLARDLRRIARTGEIVLVPDRRHDGTNVLARPCTVDLPAAYGARSFGTHLALALGSGLPTTVRRDPLLSLDVDTVADWRHPLVATVLRPIVGDPPR